MKFLFWREAHFWHFFYIFKFIYFIYYTFKWFLRKNKTQQNGKATGRQAAGKFFGISFSFHFQLPKLLLLHHPHILLRVCMQLLRVVPAVCDSWWPPFVVFLAKLLKLLEHFALALAHFTDEWHTITWVFSWWTWNTGRRAFFYSKPTALSIASL